MPDFILHHYAASPFSEKVRLVFGAKRLAWRSVHIPTVMPKPDVVALTGGYRKTPFLQIGADVYCDTALMCRVIDVLAPEPPLYPGDAAGTAQMLAQWADSTLFWTVIPYTMQPRGIVEVLAGATPEMLKAFGVDRAAFTAGMRRQTPVDAEAALRQYLGWLEMHAGDGRGFLVRGTLSIADFSVAHCLWFMKRSPTLAVLLDGYPALASWYARITAFGHGAPTPMESADALAVAAAAETRAPVQVQPGLGFEPGARVTVAALDYGTDPVTGALVGLDGSSVTLGRRDERAGLVHVHFPRIGFQIKPEAIA